MRVGGNMYNQKNLLTIYNNQRTNKISQEELASILPKLYVIINKLKCGDNEIVILIDSLISIKMQGSYDKITIELIDFIIRIINSNDKAINNFNFPAFLMITVLPYNTSYVEAKRMAVLTNIKFFISIIVDGLVDKKLTKQELDILRKYNKELANIVNVAIDVERIYRKHLKNNQIVKYIKEHMEALLYVRLEEYDFNYDILLYFIGNVVNSPAIYNAFMATCVQKGIDRSSTRSIGDIIKGYILETNDLIEGIAYRETDKILERFYQLMEEKEKSGERNDGQYSGN